MLKKTQCLSSEKGKPELYEKVEVIRELRQKYPLMALLRCAGIPRSTYYYYEKKKAQDKHRDLKKHITRIFNENKGRYGYRRITIQLRNEGVTANHKLVLKLMNELGLHCKVKRKKYKSYKGDIGKAADNVLNRMFKADRPGEKWTTDVSEFSITAGKLYLSPILDMFNGEIVSYHIGKSPNFRQTMVMLQDALNTNLNITGLIMHSDQGWQYRQNEYQNILKKAGIIQSMSRKGNCLDNSVMENFFGLMKSEMFYGEESRFKSLDELELAMRDYIEYYNNERIKLRLRTSPVKYREEFQKNGA
ncbi:MAG: IS3 family transposase [Pseudobutyrivibrio sp.]|nr:IS3 family transposase [Pseudobutyrivibrio sp.]